MGRVQRLLILAVVLGLGCRVSTAELNGRADAAAVLFRQYETVFYTAGPLLARVINRDGLNTSGNGVTRLPFLYLLGGLQSLRADASAGILQNSEAVLLGAKGFASPRGLGPVRSIRCYVVVMLPNTRLNIRKYFRSAGRRSAKGLEVFSWSARLNEFGEEDPKASKLYATLISDSFLLVTNSLDELEIVASKLSSAVNSDEILRGIPDWVLVNRCTVWGYRRYRNAGIPQPPATAMSFVTPDTSELVSFLDLDKGAVVVRLHGLGKFENSATKMQAIARLPDFKPDGAGTLETKFALADGEDCSDRLIRIMFFFGFGSYV